MSDAEPTPARPLLDGLRSREQLLALASERLPALAEELRAFLTDTVSRSGGHLASNLGLVELTLALHRAFDPYRDRIVFDVGHQCYVHKILTGRAEGFARLRRTGGLSGFPNPLESAADPFVVGHAATALSSALGLATAYRLRGEERKVVAVVGDGALGGGMSFEALNCAGHAEEDLLVVLNDNAMAIARTIGAFSTYLTEIRTRPATRRLREEIHQFLQYIPLVGPSLERFQENLLDAVKAQVLESHLFTDLGFRYFGPVDGHDAAALERELDSLRRMRGPRLLHVVTEKGRGFHAAAADPESYHSAPPFEIRSDGVVVSSPTAGESYGERAIDRLLGRARADERLVAITAAMPAGTGMDRFAEAYPERYVDVGIAEEHAVAFAAALAAAGMRPVVAIYSTFLQRSYDPIVHDVALQPSGPDGARGLPVLFLLDRAGLVGGDGPTHHGVFDIAYLRHVPGLVLMAPRDGEEMEAMVDFALALARPTAIRYPKGCPPPKALPLERTPLALGRSETLRAGGEGTVFAYGRMVAPALAAAARLAEEGVALGVVNARFAKPLDEEAIRRAAGETGLVVTVEDHAVAGGFGSAVAEYAAGLELPCRVVRLGIPDRFIEHGAVADLDRRLGLDEAGLLASFRAVVEAHRAEREAPVSSANADAPPAAETPPASSPAGERNLPADGTGTGEPVSPLRSNAGGEEA